MANNVNFGSAAFWAFFVDIIKDMAKSLASKTGDMTADSIKKFILGKPRVLVDFLIDQLRYGGEEFSAEDGAEAERRFKKKKLPRAVSKRKPCGENKLYTVLCGILELDKDPETKLYNMDFPRAKRRYVKLFLMDKDDFDQSINAMIDDPFIEFVEHFSRQLYDYTNTLADKVLKELVEIRNKFGNSVDGLTTKINDLNSKMDTSWFRRNTSWRK